MSNSTAPRRPDKPYPDFPLCAHATGYWVKRINRQLHRFGRWGRQQSGKLVRLPGNGWKEALANYNAEKDDIAEGRRPRHQRTGDARSADIDGATVMYLCNKFLTAKNALVQTGELTNRSFLDYKRITDKIILMFGKRRLIEDLDGDDFAALRTEIAKNCGPVRLNNEIQQVRAVFKFAFEEKLIAAPIRYGARFKRVQPKTLRKHRAESELKMFEAAEIKRLLDAASPQMKAMILLGVNCGFGNTDCGKLTFSALDLKGGWVAFPRPKTGIDRRAWLWPETIEAIQEAIAVRPAPKVDEHEQLVFITKRRMAWAKDSPSNPLSAEFRKLQQAIDKQAAKDAEEQGCEPPHTLRRKGVGFYSLRHTFQTIADETRDFPAIAMVMGHCDNSSPMAARYRERISDERLQAVGEAVRAWLFGEGQSNG